MSHSIKLSSSDYKTLLDWYRSHPTLAVRLRCHIILLLHKEYKWSWIVETLFTSTSTISRWKNAFLLRGPEGLLGDKPGRPAVYPSSLASEVCEWVGEQQPTNFGFIRSRWSCALLVLCLWQIYSVNVSQETVRRWLHRGKMVWRRPRPILERQDPQREDILLAIRKLLLNLPEDETVVFQDEVDINLNPEIGCMWMPLGQQATIPTPGNNQKNYLAGSLHWRTGLLIKTVGKKRNSQLFLEHLDEVRRRLRRYRKIHVILDNAKFHESEAVAEWYYRWYGRVEFHFLPKYAPDLNPIERVWWHLREEITRNHRCNTQEELIGMTLNWIQSKSTFQIETSEYADLQAV